MHSALGRALWALILLTGSVLLPYGTFAASGRPASNVPYIIRNVQTGKCIDIPNGQAIYGTPVNQFRCHGGPAQRFSLFQPAGYVQIRFVAPFCIAALGSQRTLSDGVLLGLLPCETSGIGTPQTTFSLDALSAVGNTWRTAFRWALDPSRFCIDVPSGAPDDSLRLQAYRCHGGPNQSWIISP